ncbi:cytidylate kinase-like family protein [Campylobacter sp. VBCF_05 NA6]|uniref:cytidylate kinase-like family protein n=1 Tax=unclassified Campylobacter TaxID=2593542 RepID=UPI0022E9BC65|nr:MULTISPECIES: cytidylate kinase-like family protein [unclassified Campylobacter]MDA3057068.1 cytidylate kinase-like family protein [Campylobacter sp. VBCF_04 NA7]MDA3059641.1 cytidylate kinase-like family protein [Campylobacter sp. VBCF_05 NA6]
MVITIARQTGAGGRELAQKLAARLGYTYLEKADLLKRADSLGCFEMMYEFYNEMPINMLLHAISHNEIANEEKRERIAKIYRQIAHDGNIIILGRCAGYFLRSRGDLLRVFLRAEDEFKLTRLASETKGDVREFMENSDAGRASFHRYYTNEIWGASQNYDICINTSFCGVDGAAQIVENLIKFKENLGDK